MGRLFSFVKFSFVPGNRVRSYVVRLCGSPLDVVVITVQGSIRNFVVSFVCFVFWSVVGDAACLLDTVILVVDDHRECSGCPRFLRILTRYELFRNVAARFPRCFAVTVPLNVEFE